jgi:hypothetical protein
VVLAALPLAAQPAVPADQAPPIVQVALTPNEPTVGDRVDATLILRLPATGLIAPPRFPAWGETWGEAEVLGKNAPEKAGERGGIVTWQQRVVLAAFRPGKVELPPVTIAVPLADRTIQAATPPGLAIKVRSVLPSPEQEPRPEPKPALPPRPLPIGEPFWWTLAALSAACLAGALLLWRRGRRALAEEAATRPALPPFDELAVELDRLAAEPSVLQVHTRLSLALRRYLGRVIPFPAVESTTSEIQRQLLARRVPGPAVRQTVELLRACDMVKFARQEVGEERARERVDAARRIGREFEAHFAPPPAESLEKAG